MTVRKSTVREVLEQVQFLFETQGVSSLAFAIVREDGVPVFGHANASYDLLGAVTMMQTAMAAKMLRDTEDAPGFEGPEDH